MRVKFRIIPFTIFAIIQFGIQIPLNAAVYDISDIALTPGRDITELNIAWHHIHNDCNCVAEIAEKPNNNELNAEGTRLSEHSHEFYGSNKFIGVDENSVVTYACEITVSGLKDSTDYVYRLGNGEGDWSGTHEYATRDKNRYGLFYVADPQIGASGPTFEEAKAYIAEYQTRKTYPDLSDENIKLIVDAYVNNALTETFIGLTELKEAIDLLCDTFFKDTTDKLANLKAIDPDLAKEIFALQTAAAEQDSKSWAETVRIMTDKFPEAAFILSAGDQVELVNREYEYTGFFSPSELTSLPVAPAIGNHERAVNFKYHFNLPNESSEYGVSIAGGDYYFSHGNALFIVLNMDATTSLFPQEPPPDPGGSAPGGAPPPPGQGGGPQGGAPPLPGQGGGPQGGAPPPPGQGGGPQGGAPPPPGQDIPIDNEEEFELALSELEQYCDEETGECYDKLEKFKKSVAEHKKFMEEAISANPNAKWKIVMWHYSIYSAGIHAAENGTRALKYYMVPVLDDLDVDLVLSGHDHCFARTYQMLGDDPQPEQEIDKRGRIVNPTGILYLTANSSSGSKYYELHLQYDVEDNPDTEEKEEPDPYFEYVAVANQLEVPQFSYINVDSESLEISTYRTDTMEMIDSYAIVKEGKNLPGK